MSFASDYLESGPLFQELINEAPDRNTGIIVVIPSYNEPDITVTLNSLAACTEPECKTEVLIIVNAPPDSSSEGLKNNILTIGKIESWKKLHFDCFFRLYYFDAGQPEINRWGVGLARKTGMDEAVRRFNFIDRPYGVIASLDADCTIEKNYFISLNEELLKNSERKACSVYFEHPISGNDYPQELYRAITLYELHLRYYFQALKYTGFPYVHHTVGSALAIKASAYVKAGGMNRKQAGEDFYFVQKLVSAGGFFNLYSTTVYPSPRISGRVPFGTGHAVGKLSLMESPEYLTYDFSAFNDISKLFSRTDNLFNSDLNFLANEYSNLPDSLRFFISEEEWMTRLAEIVGNTATIDSFRKRFFNWFNMFKVVKYLNFVHGSIYCKKEVVKESEEFLDFLSIKHDKNNPEALLLQFRDLEKKH
jgi:GT2 family glycosyltransferase